MYVTVEIDQGSLRGQEKTSEYLSNMRYFSFQGVPYSKPPVGPLRFKDPEEPKPWTGVRAAVKEGNDCTQLHMLFLYNTGSEDCLYLNVYTPQLCASGKPVMVYIYGASFNSGSGSTELCGPDYFMEEGVVLVTTNYRVGALVYGLNEDNIGNEDDKFEKFVPQNMGLPIGSNKSVHVENELKYSYFGDDTVSLKTLDEYVAVQHMENGDITLFLFSQNRKGWRKPSTEDKTFSSKVCKIWATFARTGNPNYNGMEAKWKPVTKDNFCYLDIGDELKLSNGQMKEDRMQIWQQLYGRYPHVY